MGSKQVCAWSPAWDLLFSSFYRTTWCISLGMLAWAALAGQAGPIAAVLGSSFWTPIARLTFGVYLCHIMVVRLLYYSVAKPFDCKTTHRVNLAVVHIRGLDNESTARRRGLHRRGHLHQ